MATYRGEDQTAQLFIWLRLHGANPDEVPLDADMTISTDGNGVRWLNWVEYALINGGRYMNPWGTGAAAEKHKTRLVSPPPDWWEPQIQPTREALAHSRDQAYLERDYALALLARHHPAVISPADDADDRAIGRVLQESDWQALVIIVQDMPLRFNIAPSSADLFEHVEHVPVDDPRAQPGERGVRPDRVADQLWRDKLPLPVAGLPPREQLLVGVAAVVETLPSVRLIATPEGRHIEVWHTDQPEQYQVTEEHWRLAESPDQVDVRHVLAARAL